MSQSQQKPHGAQFNHKERAPLYRPSLPPACRDMDIELFYPPKGADAPQEAIDACEACAVNYECFLAAMREETGKQRWGVRAGLTPEERDKLVRKEYDAKRVRNPRGRPKKIPVQNEAA